MITERRKMRGELRRLAKDESGMTMGLVIVTMVLVGVMGAGLLTFVATDLNTVVEVNQGQRAFEMADAGIASAAQQLATMPNSELYDNTDADNTQWASTNNGMMLNDLDGDNNTATNDRVTVTISSTAGAGGGQDAGDVNQAYNCTTYNAAANSDPAVQSSFVGETTYKVTATGRYGEATRRVEATFKGGAEGSNSGYTGLPMGLYATGDVEFGSGVQIRCMSLFSKSYLKGGEIFETNTPTIDGPDIYLGNWVNPPWNIIPRSITPVTSGTNRTSAVESGLGFYGNTSAGKSVKYNTSTHGNARIKSTTLDTTGGMDYFGITPENGPASLPRLVDNTWAQDSNPATVQGTQIGFPFDSRPDVQIDSADLAALKAEAQSQEGGHYRNFGSTDAKLGDNLPASWLNEADDVAYVEFTRNSDKIVQYPNSCGNFTNSTVHPCPRGTLVIINGVFAPSTGAGHEGVVIVRGESANDKQGVEAQSSDFHMKGFMNVEGNLTLQTNARILPIDPAELDDYYPFDPTSSGGGGAATTPTLTSWREVYQ